MLLDSYVSTDSNAVRSAKTTTPTKWVATSPRGR